MTFFQASLIAMAAIVVAFSASHLHRFFRVYKRTHTKYLYLACTAFGIAIYIVMQFLLSTPRPPDQVLLFHRIKIAAVDFLVPSYLITIAVIASRNSRTALSHLALFFVPALAMTPFDFFLSLPARQVVIATPLGLFTYAFATSRLGYSIFSVALIMLFFLATAFIARSTVIRSKRLFILLALLPVVFAANDFLVVHGVYRSIVLSEYYFFVLVITVSFVFLREEDDNQKRLENINAELEERIRERTAELEKANTRLQELATTDVLTGLDNRQSLINLLTEERARYVRYHGEARRSFSAVFIDLDNFKYYNDTFGHAAGDFVLCLFANLFRSMVRTCDIVARVGGDEFVIILPETELAGAEEFARRIHPELAACGHFRKAMGAFLGRSIDVPEQSIINCSIGIAVYDREMDIDTLLASADKALYLAKSRGKRCLAVWSENEPAEGSADGGS